VPRLLLYGTDCCHLCEEMRRQLEPWRLRHGFEIQWVEISGDAELERRYGTLIPVLADAASGRELCHYHLDDSALERWLGASCIPPA